MCGVVLQEPRSVHRIRYDVEGGRIGCESLTLAEVATVRLRHADERVHAAGIAAKDFVHSNTRHAAQTHYGVVREHGVDAQQLHFSNRRVKHHARALVVVYNTDVLAEKDLRVKNGSGEGHLVDRESSSSSTGRSSPWSCFREEDSTRVTHLRMCGFQGIDPHTALSQSPSPQ